MVELILDASGNDVTRIPASPLGLRAFPTAGGKVRIEWTCPGGGPFATTPGFSNLSRDRFRAGLYPSCRHGRLVGRAEWLLRGRALPG